MKNNWDKTMKFDRLKNELIKLGWGAEKENVPDYEPNNISKYGLTIILTFLFLLILLGFLLVFFGVIDA